MIFKIAAERGGNATESLNLARELWAAFQEFQIPLKPNDFLFGRRGLLVFCWFCISRGSRVFVILPRPPFFMKRIFVKNDFLPTGYLCQIGGSFESYSNWAYSQGVVRDLEFDDSFLGACWKKRSTHFNLCK